MFLLTIFGPLATVVQQLQGFNHKIRSTVYPNRTGNLLLDGDSDRQGFSTYTGYYASVSTLSGVQISHHSTLLNIVQLQSASLVAVVHATWHPCAT